MSTRLTLGTEGSTANADHVVGALVLTVVVTATAESGRMARYALVPLGLALFTTPFLLGAPLVSVVSSLLCGALLIGLSLRKGHIRASFGKWDKFIV